MSIAITNPDQLGAQPVGTVIRAHWADGSQPDHFIVRSGETNGSGATSSGWTIAGEKAWAQIIEWGADLTVFSRPDDALEQIKAIAADDDAVEALTLHLWDEGIIRPEYTAREAVVATLSQIQERLPR